MTLVLATAPANGLRSTHASRSSDGSVYRSTKVEPERTNKIANSRDVSDTGIWTRLALADITPDAAVGPNGVDVDAQYVEEDDTNAVHGFSRNLTSYLLTDDKLQLTGFALKAGERTHAFIQTTTKGNTTRRTWFNLTTKARGTTHADHTAYVVALDNGWGLYMVIWNIASGVTSPAIRFGMATGDNVQTYDGDVSTPHGLYVGWAELQSDITYNHPTMFIETSSGALTRDADVAYDAGYAYPPRECTILISFVERGTINRAGGTIDYVGRSDVTGARRYVESTGTYYQAVWHNGTTSVASTLVTAPVWGNQVDLLIWHNDDGSVQINMRVDGGGVATATASSALALEPSYGAGAVRYLGSKGGTQVGCVDFCQTSNGKVCVLETAGIHSFEAMLAARGDLLLA